MMTCVHVAMYLLLTPSPYSGEDLVNYKSIGKAENIPGKGQLLDAVSLNSNYEVQALTYFSYPKWEPFRRPYTRVMSHLVAPSASR